MNESQNMIYQNRVGDYLVAIVGCGMSQDADSMMIGWVYTTRDGANVSRANGITWDGARILVDCSQPLTVREVEALQDAGFLVDDTFLQSLAAA